MQDGLNIRVNEEPPVERLGRDEAADGDAQTTSPRHDERAPGFRANATVFWIPGSPQRRSGPTVADKLASLPAETEHAEPSTIVVTGSPRRTPATRGNSSSRQPFRVGPYEVAARIAQGGMGSVYLCRRAAGTTQSEVGPLYALKVIRQHASHAEASRSFEREAQVGAYLRHPNLHRVIEAGTYEHQPFLIYDYVEGASLGDLLSEETAPPVRVAVSVLLDVLRGLHAAHTARDERGSPLGIIHGDLSPSNVLVGVDGRGRLTDFGCASFAQERLSRDDGARASFGGRAAYAAPEVLCGEGGDARSDVLSMGIIMWELLTGQKLFAAATYDQTVLNVLRKRVPPPSSVGAPACLDEICLRACLRDPEGRFDSAEEMADALERVAKENGLLGTHLGNGPEVSDWVRREWGEHLAERRRWARRAFDGAPPPEAAKGESEGAKKRLPAKTIQLAAVVSRTAGAPRYLDPTQTIPMLSRAQRGDDRVQSAPMQDVADDVADLPEDLDSDLQEDMAAAGLWWRRPWVVVALSALLAFGLTVIVACLSERGPSARDPEVRADSISQER